MASLLSTTKAAVRTGRDEVYVGAVALRATKGPAQLLMSTAYSLNLWDFQHFMVIIRPSNPAPASSRVVVFDFQPKDPENIFAAVSVLSGRSIPGVVMKRNLKAMPKRKCWFIGYSKLEAVEMAGKFSNGWETQLRVGSHDCRDYTNGLVEYLTGEKSVLDRLRSTVNYS